MGTTACVTRFPCRASNTSSNRGQGRTLTSDPNNFRAAAWLKAPGSPWNATLVLLGVLIGDIIPSRRFRVGHAEQIKHPVDGMIDDFEHAPRLMVEARNGRRDDSAHFRDCRHR